jgi:nifR3 family TIM-barrel protein
MVIFMKWKIGNVEISNQVVLAPMAGICNSAFRTIIKEMGCGLIYAEMVSDKALVYKSKKTKEMLYMTEYERPIVQQVFGSDKDSFVSAAKIIYEEMKPDIIDINMGCPVPKVAVRAQAGSALLKDINKIKDIVSSVVKSVPVPVTVKIRSGWDNNSINAVEVAKACEEAGASAICIHPRTRSQGYTGVSDWSVIKAAKENVTIPVIGNGDIKSAEDAKRMLDETHCDAIMVGRAVLGNPWLIKDIVYYLETGKHLPEVSNREKLLMCKKHFEYLLKIKSEKLALLEIRSHAAWYVKKMPHSNVIKLSVYNTKTKEEFKELIDGYLQQM